MTKTEMSVPSAEVGAMQLQSSHFSEQKHFGLACTRWIRLSGRFKRGVSHKSSKMVIILLADKIRVRSQPSR